MKNKPEKAVDVSSWADMLRFGVAAWGCATDGVVPLCWRSSPASGERSRFVLNAEGCRLLQEYWGLVEAKFASVEKEMTVNGEPAVAEVFLSYSELFPLAEFALFRMQPVGLAYRDGSVKAVFDEALYDQLRKTHSLKFNDARHSLRKP